LLTKISRALVWKQLHSKLLRYAKV